MSNIFNDLALERIAEEVDELSTPEIVNELGITPPVGLSNTMLKGLCVEILKEKLVMKRFEELPEAI